jgi:hypothetical protein
MPCFTSVTWVGQADTAKRVKLTMINCITELRHYPSNHQATSATAPSLMCRARPRVCTAVLRNWQCDMTSAQTAAHYRTCPVGVRARRAPLVIGRRPEVADHILHRTKAVSRSGDRIRATKYQQVESDALQLTVKQKWLHSR